MTLRLRELTEEEDRTVERLVHARNTPVGKLKRAQIIRPASRGMATPEIAKHVDVSERMVRTRLHRFNEQGLQGQSTTAGKVSAAKIIAGGILLGPIGALVGAGRSKDTITLTFVRTPE